MRHFRSLEGLSASFPVVPLALGVTVAPAPRLLVTLASRAPRLSAGDAGTARPAVLLTAVTARADPHLALTPCTQK